MDNNTVASIDAWFAEHSDDGEFVCGTAAAPYSVISLSKTVARILYTTKPNVASVVIGDGAEFSNVGIVGRYGLPSLDEVRRLGETFGSQQFLFLGDMDPVDLMIFYWLSEHLRSPGVVYLGINDAFLCSIEITSTKPFVMPQTSSEREALHVLSQVAPDMRSTLGPQCAGILERGQKLELEIMLSAKQKAGRFLRSAGPPVP